MFFKFNFSKNREQFRNKNLSRGIQKFGKSGDLDNVLRERNYSTRRRSLCRSEQVKEANDLGRWQETSIDILLSRNTFKGIKNLTRNIP